MMGGFNTLTGYEIAALSMAMDHAVPVIRRLYKPNCCIAATRVMLEVFHWLQVPARPLMVRCIVLNPALVAMGGLDTLAGIKTSEGARPLVDGGAWLIELGDPDHEALPGQWPGHLVCCAFGKVLCDLSLPQASRPHKGINLIPMASEVAPIFFTDEVGWKTTCNGSEVWYNRVPDDGGYKKARDWYHPLHRDRAVRLIKKSIRRRWADAN